MGIISLWAFRQCSQWNLLALQRKPPPKCTAWVEVHWKAAIFNSFTLREVFPLSRVTLHCLSPFSLPGPATARFALPSLMLCAIPLCPGYMCILNTHRVLQDFLLTQAVVTLKKFVRRFIQTAWNSYKSPSTLSGCVRKGRTLLASNSH